MLDKAHATGCCKSPSGTEEANMPEYEKFSAHLSSRAHRADMEVVPNLRTLYMYRTDGAGHHCSCRQRMESAHWLESSRLLRRSSWLDNHVVVAAKAAGLPARLHSDIDQTDSTPLLNDTDASADMSRRHTRVERGAVQAKVVEYSSRARVARLASRGVQWTWAHG